MFVHGFAYTTDEDVEADRRRNIVKSLNELSFGDYVTINSKGIYYAKHAYSGTVDRSFSGQFTPQDLLFWLDGFTVAPFGGVIDYDSSTGRFSAIIYTD